MKWTKRECGGAIPESRGSHAQVVVGDKLFMFGGTDGRYAYNDMHALDLGNSIKCKYSPCRDIHLVQGCCS